METKTMTNSATTMVLMELAREARLVGARSDGNRLEALAELINRDWVARPASHVRITW